MFTRLLFVVIVTFWVLMNVLLWREEFGRGRETLSEVPLETVVDRILNAPDPSVLQIKHRGVQVGSLRWIPTVEETGAPAGSDGVLPEGMIEAAGYNLDLDLNLNLGEAGPASRTRLLAHVDLSTNRVWQAASVRLFQRPASWEVTAKAGSDQVHVRFEEGKTTWEQDFAARDLRRMTSSLGPYAALLPPPLAAQFNQWQANTALPQLHWVARNDWLKLGRSRVRTYRVQAKLFDRYEIVIHLSRAGEILQIKLPDNLTLLNEGLPALDRP